MSDIEHLMFTIEHENCPIMNIILELLLKNNGLSVGMAIALNQSTANIVPIE